MDASIKKTVRASDKDAQYDEKAKKLLGHKIILAYILVNTIEEFREMNPKEVVNYIEGEPYISVVPVDSGMTNRKKKAGDNPGKELEEDTKTIEQVSGLNTENSEINEGMIRFDIIFYVRMKDGLTKIIINVEAQKEEKYELHRLLSALLSSDLEVEDKLDIMEKEYDIPLENDIRKDVKEMCNLSQGIREEAFEEGQEYGYREGQEKGEKQKLVRVVTKMHEAKFPLEQIAAIAEISVENVKEIID